MAKTIKIKEGECFSSLAAKYDFLDYTAIYGHPDNQSIHDQRPNPNTLNIDDEIIIPDKKEKKEKENVSKVVTVKMDKPKPIRLRIAVIDRIDKPLKQKEFKINVGTKNLASKTDNKGLIELKEILPKEIDGELSIVLKKPPAAVKKAKPASKPDPKKDPPYPPPIIPDDFKDVEEKDYTGKELLDLKINLKVGALPSYNEIEGVQVRLNNLGFTCAEINGIEGPLTYIAVKRYQKFYKLKETGDAADIQESIKKKHDNL
jgi:hypothetical protein